MSSGALGGLHVVSMALNLPGPLAAARLAAEGAEVTKVEPPDGDPLAAICRRWYDELHCGVSVERVDLKTEAGRERMRVLLAGADVFLSCQRPSALARLGLTARSLSHVRWLNIVGERAQPEIAGHDLTYQARAGLLGTSMPVSLFADIMGSERAFAAVLLLLRQPPGAHDEVGLFDSVATLAAPLAYGLTTPRGPLGGGLPGYAIYRAREGAVAVAALEPHFRARLYDALGLARDSPLDAVMQTRTAAEWEAWGRAHDVPITRVTSTRSDHE